MSFKRLLFMTGLCVLFTGCSTGRYTDPATNQPATPALMGERYLLGRGVPQDDAKAFAYFKTAANDEDPFAQSELAFLYASGRGTPRDNTQAFKWYQKAANHGLASAQYNLSLMYLHGIGTAPNQALATLWLERSAAHGFEPARAALAKMRT